MTNILFFIEPSFELENPGFKGNFLILKAAPLAKTLREAFGDSVHMKVIVNDGFAEYGKYVDLDKVVFKQSELYDLMKENPLDYRIGFFAERLQEEMQLRYARRISAKLDGFVPDVIIAFNNANFMKTVYPDAAIIHNEFGFFNREPFPESWFFDPVAASGSAWINRYWPEVSKQWKPTDVEMASAREIMDVYKSTIQAHNPLAAFFESIKPKYKSINLLPLQFSHQPYFEGYLPIGSQLQLAIATLEKIPLDEGLVITEHPMGSLKPDAMAYLKATYPQLITLPDLQGRVAISQFVAPYCDTIISAASTVAALKLFWGNGLVNLTSRYLPCLSDSSSLDEPLPKSSKMDEGRRLHFFSWLIHRYLNVPAQREDPEWMQRFIAKTIEVHRSGNAIDFYDATVWQTPERRAQAWLDAIHHYGNTILNSETVRIFIDCIHGQNDRNIHELYPEAVRLADEMEDCDDRMMLCIFLGYYNYAHPRHFELAVQYNQRAAEISERLMVSEITVKRVHHYWYALFHAALFAQEHGQHDVTRAIVDDMQKSQALYGTLSQYFIDRIANELTL